MMMRFLMASMLVGLCVGNVFGQSAGDYLFQRKKLTGAGFDNITLGPVEGNVIRFEGGLLVPFDVDAALGGKLDLEGDGSGLTGITAGQVGALADGDTVGFLQFNTAGLRLLDPEGDHVLQIGFNQSLSANRALIFAVNDANRTINLSGDLTVPAAATVSGTNTGDVTLAGTPNYLTIAGQVITRALINLNSHVTGILGRANGGTGLSSAGASGNVLTSDGTNWTSAAPTSPVILGYKRADYTTNASGTTTCGVIASTTLRPMTEGTEFMSITYTPKNAASRLRVEVFFTAGCSTASWGGLLLARSGDANARAQCQNEGGIAMNGANGVYRHQLVFDEVSGTTSAITYNVRFGGNQPGTFYMNRPHANTMPANGATSYIEITEYTP